MKEHSHKGFALLMAVIVTSTLLLVVYALSNITLKELQLSSAGRDSQVAFYAADQGMECAFFWDTKNPNSATGQSAFATSTTGDIACGNAFLSSEDSNPANWSVPSVPNPIQMQIGGVATSTFYFATDMGLGIAGPCAIVRVNKRYGIASKGEDVTQIYTTIISRGYNSCDINNPRRIERAIKATY